MINHAIIKCRLITLIKNLAELITCSHFMQCIWTSTHWVISPYSSSINMGLQKIFYDRDDHSYFTVTFDNCPIMWLKYQANANIGPKNTSFSCMKYPGVCMFSRIKYMPLNLILLLSLNWLRVGYVSCHTALTLSPLSLSTKQMERNPFLSLTE